jgi:hypothetical protein
MRVLVFLADMESELFRDRREGQISGATTYSAPTVQDGKGSAKPSDVHVRPDASVWVEPFRTYPELRKIIEIVPVSPRDGVLLSAFRV